MGGSGKSTLSRLAIVLVVLLVLGLGTVVTLLVLHYLPKSHGGESRVFKIPCCNACGTLWNCLDVMEGWDTAQNGLHGLCCSGLRE